MLDGDPAATVREATQEAGLVAGVLTGSILGILPSRIAGSIYHAWVVYAVIPPCPSACWWRT